MCVWVETGAMRVQPGEKLLAFALGVTSLMLTDLAGVVVRREGDLVRVLSGDYEGLRALAAAGPDGALFVDGNGPVAFGLSA